MNRKGFAFEYFFPVFTKIGKNSGLFRWVFIFPHNFKPACWVDNMHYRIVYIDSSAGSINIYEKMWYVMLRKNFLISLWINAKKMGDTLNNHKTFMNDQSYKHFQNRFIHSSVLCLKSATFLPNIHFKAFKVFFL